MHVTRDVVLDLPVEEVWHLLTDPDELAAWFATPVAFDLRPGGVAAFVGRTGPATATELAAHLPVTRQAVVKHLDTLRAAGLVDSNRTGRDVRYGLRPAPLETAAHWMERVGATWDRRLARLSDRATT